MVYWKSIRKYFTEQKDMEVAEKKSTEQPEMTPVHSREPLFGALFFFFILLVTLVIVAIVIWFGYRGFRFNQDQAMLPSISNLATQEKDSGAPTSTPEAKPMAEPETQQTVSDEQMLTKAKGTEIRVLNGGAAKGSASVAADVLKKAGYTKVTTGNTLGDYTGVVVYYGTGLEKEAGTVKNGLLKTYPKAEVKAALPGNKETMIAPLTVILGK